MRENHCGRINGTDWNTGFLGIALVCLSLFQACSTYAHYNDPLPKEAVPAVRASFDIKDARGESDVLVALAISGGGSRAAYFATSAMFRLQDVFAELDLLEEIDVISASSGGTLPATYYCISQDWAGTPMPSNRLWQKSTVKELMARDFQSRWLGSTFLPHNIFRNLFTSYDRTDIMAQTFEDNLFDSLPLGVPLTYDDLSPERPYLILNATDVTESVPGEEHFGKIFTFTDEHFREKLNSNLGSYPLAWAVTASAAFPGAFNYMTLRDYRSPEGEDWYLHLLDGGCADNLGLESIKRVIFQGKWSGRYKHFIVILIDSFVKGKGVSRTDYDPRSAFSYLVDLNFMDTFDSLMRMRRDDLLGQFETGILDVDKDRKEKIDNLTFWHITFQDIRDDVKDHTGERLTKTLNQIPTNFGIADDDRKRVDKAADLLIHRGHPKLQKLLDILYE